MSEVEFLSNGVQRYDMKSFECFISVVNEVRYFF